MNCLSLSLSLEKFYLLWLESRIDLIHHRVLLMDISIHHPQLLSVTIHDQIQIRSHFGFLLLYGSELNANGLAQPAMDPFRFDSSSGSDSDSNSNSKFESSTKKLWVESEFVWWMVGITVNAFSLC